MPSQWREYSPGPWQSLPPALACEFEFPHGAPYAGAAASPADPAAPLRPGILLPQRSFAGKSLETTLHQTGPSPGALPPAGRKPNGLGPSQPINWPSGLRFPLLPLPSASLEGAHVSAPTQSAVREKDDGGSHKQGIVLPPAGNRPNNQLVHPETPVPAVYIPTEGGWNSPLQRGIAPVPLDGNGSTFSLLEAAHAAYPALFPGKPASVFAPSKVLPAVPNPPVETVPAGEQPAQSVDCRRPAQPLPSPLPLFASDRIRYSSLFPGLPIIHRRKVALFEPRSPPSAAGGRPPARGPYPIPFAVSPRWASRILTAPGLPKAPAEPGRRPPLFQYDGIGFPLQPAVSALVFEVPPDPRFLAAKFSPKGKASHRLPNKQLPSRLPPIPVPAAPAQHAVVFFDSSSHRCFSTGLLLSAALPGAFDRAPCGKFPEKSCFVPRFSPARAGETPLGQSSPPD